MRKMLLLLSGICWTAALMAQSYNITFRLNMNEVTSSFTTPEVNGTFNGWCGSCNPMTDTNGDGIWKTTISLPAGTYEYKYSHDNWAGQETLVPGSSCTITTGSFTNRKITVSADATLDIACWGACLDCGVAPPIRDITFQVDMNTVTSPFTTPEVNGTFNNWCGGCAPMSDTDGDNIWELTIQLEDGSYEYKFAYDSWAGSEDLSTAGSCTVVNGGFANRSLNVTADATLAPVCWGSCNVCSTGGGTQMTLPVSFDEADVAYGLVGFGGAEASTIVEDPTLPGNMVAKVIKSATAETWAGTTVTSPDNSGFSSAIPFTTTETFMSVRVWSPNAGIPIRLKVEDHADVTHTVETEVVSTVAGAWETLVFNFANEAPGTAELNLNYTFDKASIFFNFGTSGSAAGEKIYYFDDMAFGGGTAGENHNVTFSINMNEVTAPFTTPEVNGTFNAWCGGCNPLTDVNGDGIWETTIEIPSGVHEYKFAYDSWAGQENLIPGSSCTVTANGFTNRSLNVTQDAVLGTVCWESCLDCGQAPPDRLITFKVDMNDVTETYTTPEVNGTFNNWCGGCAPMSDTNGDNIWELTIPLQDGIYEYKFAYDSWAGSETMMAGAPCTVDNGGFINRSLQVTADAVLPAVCWGSCEACGALAQMTLPVTFDEIGIAYGLVGFGGAELSTVEADPTQTGNMVAKVVKSNTAETWAGTTVTAEGNLGFATPIPFSTTSTKMNVRVWSPDAGIPVRLKVEDHGDVTHTVETEAITTTSGAWQVLEFDFANEAPGTAELNLAYTFDKASIFFNFGTTGSTAGEKTYYFDDMKFGPAVSVVPVNVTFRVDMQNVAEPYTTPEVNGTFNNWCGGCAPMSDTNGDDIWELVIALEPGTYEYKFAYDTWAGQETLVPGSSCTITTGAFTNRILTVTAEEILPVVCWGSCTDCGTSSGPYNIVFSVDMSTVTATYTTPEVNGTFNNWCGGCAPMTDTNGDDIWELTIPLNAGTYEYKFAYDAWAGSEDLTPGSPCTITLDAFTNRLLTVSANATLDEVCWGSCEACVVGVEDVLTSNVIDIFPNPAADHITINLNQSIKLPATLSVINSLGQIVSSQPMLNAAKNEVNIGHLADGVYFIRVYADDALFTSPVVIRK